MEPLRIALCEDDPYERDAVLSLLQQSHYASTVRTFASGEDFLAQFQPFAFDLILMDIFMGELTGIGTITKMRLLDSAVPVAFITSSSDFTLESYRLGALQYIEKPVSKKILDSALEMAQLKRQSEDKLTLRIHGGLTTYPLSGILYLEQQGRTLLVHLLDGKVVCANKKLSDVEGQLLNKGFLRCHKSYLVNLAFVRGIDRERCTFALLGGDHVYIRKRGFWEMQKAFEAYLFALDQEVRP